MKRTNLIATAFVAGAFFLASCSGGSTEQTNEETNNEENTTEEAVETQHTVDVSSSSVTWKGEMLGAYAHSGTVGVSSGSLTMKGDVVSGGEFTVDLTSIVPTDENYGEDNPKEKLIGHLSSDDFFGVESFPTATYKVESVEGTTATGTLTIKGQSNTESVTDIAVTAGENGGYTITGNLTFDRQKYGVAWASTMKDMVLGDDIPLTINLVTSN